MDEYLHSSVLHGCNYPCPNPGAGYANYRYLKARVLNMTFNEEINLLDLALVSQQTEKKTPFHARDCEIATIILNDTPVHSCDTEPKQTLKPGRKYILIFMFVKQRI